MEQHKDGSKLISATGATIWSGFAAAQKAEDLTAVVAAARRRGQQASSPASCAKSALSVIPNEVRNLSGFKSQEKERFLGTQRASE